MKLGLVLRTQHSK